MLVRSRDLAVRISEEQPETFRLPVDAARRKARWLSIRSRRMASRRLLRIGGLSPTVRLNLWSGRFGSLIRAHWLVIAITQQ